MFDDDFSHYNRLTKYGGVNMISHYLIFFFNAINQTWLWALKNETEKKETKKKTETKIAFWFRITAKELNMKSICVRSIRNHGALWFLFNRLLRFIARRECTKFTTTTATRLLLLLFFRFCVFFFRTIYLITIDLKFTCRSVSIKYSIANWLKLL